MFRYGFNGKEKDQNNEFGDVHYDYGFRIFDPNVARFLSVDPLTKSYPELTPYQFASNTPIMAIDLDGLEAEIVNSKLKDKLGWKMTMEIADQVSMNLEFKKALLSQNKFDVYYFTFRSVRGDSDGNVFSGLTYLPDGSIDGIGTRGVTDYATTLGELEIKERRTSTLRGNINFADLEATFMAGKGVVLIGIAEQHITPFDKKQQFERWTDDQLDNLNVDASSTLVHERDAHAKDVLKNGKFTTDIPDAHFRL